MPVKRTSVDLDSMLPPVGQQRPSETRTLPQIKTTPPANKSNKDLYTPHSIPLTEIQWYAIIHASEMGIGVKLKHDKGSKYARKVTIPLTNKQYDNFNSGRTITLSFRQLNMMRRGGFLTAIASLLAESPVLAGLAAELAKPVIREVGNLAGSAVKKLGNAVGLGEGVGGSIPKRRGKK